MASKDDTGTKDQKATPKKLRDARKKGQVAQSRELTGAAGLVGGVVAVAFSLPFVVGYYAQIFDNAVNATNSIGTGRVAPSVMQAFAVISSISLPILFVCAFVSSLAARIQTGSVFSIEPVTPKLERVNPINLIKQIFSVKSIVMLLLMIGKTLLMGIGIAVVFFFFMGDAIKMLLGGAPAALTVFREANIALVAWCVIAFVALAMLDFAYQKLHYMREMRMSLHDIKRERRDDEGDPIIKSARRAASREANMVDQLQYVSQASLVIVDHEGRAIALAYLPEQFRKPIVVVRAAGGLGQHAVMIAQNAGVPVVSRIELMGRLWPLSRNSATVPDAFEEELVALIRYHRREN